MKKQSVELIFLLSGIYDKRKLLQFVKDLRTLEKEELVGLIEEANELRSGFLDAAARSIDKKT